MNPLDLLFGQVRDAISNHSSPNTPGPSYDANPLLSQLSGLFGQTAQQHNLPYENQYGNVAPASQDPFGDPADSPSFNQTAYGGQGVLPSSQDPFGDPADNPRNQGMGEIAPASQDPFGDPADQR